MSKAQVAMVRGTVLCQFWRTTAWPENPRRITMPTVGQPSNASYRQFKPGDAVMLPPATDDGTPKKAEQRWADPRRAL